MAVKKLHGAFGCRSTMRALAPLTELELDFEFIPLDVNAGEHQKNSFLALSPFGEIPVYQEEDLTVFGSRAIMRYITHSFPIPEKALIFAEPKLQGLVANWIDIEDHQFDPPATKLINELLNKPKLGLTTDQAVVAKETEKLTKVLDVYEERLNQSDYLGGCKFTSADLTHLPNLYYLMDTPVKQLFYERPRVCAWANDILARPAWNKVVAMVNVTD
jgi:glutathione S-transferase